MSGIDCGEVLRRIDVYLDGELAEGERRELEAHVAACFPCAGHRDFRVTLQRLVREKCSRAELPPGLADRIRAGLRGR